MKMLHDFLSFLTNERKLSKSTAKFYKTDILIFQAFLGSKSLKEVTEADIQTYVDYLQQANYKPASISRKISSLSTLFRFLETQGFIEESPIRHDKSPGAKLNIRRPATERRNVKYLSSDEAEKLMESIHTATELFTLRDKALYLLMFKTGIRAPEAQSIRMGDISFPAQQITYTPLNKSCTKIIPLTEDIKPTIEDYYFALLKSKPQISDDAPFFMNKDGNPIGLRSIRRNLNTHAERAGLEVSPSRLRHSFAIEQIQKGRTKEQLKEELGHVNIASTEVYAQHFDAQTQDLGVAAEIEQIECDEKLSVS